MGLQRVWILRKFLNELNPVDAMEFLITKLVRHQDEQEIPRQHEFVVPQGVGGA